MSFSKARLRRYIPETKSYDIIHLETSASMIVDGKDVFAVKDHIHTPQEIGASALDHQHRASDIAEGNIPVNHGGTGASTAAAARQSLGITPENINAANKVHTHTVEDLSGVAKEEHTHTFNDIREVFEWEDGNTNKENRVGMLVTLTGEKIRLANSEDDCFGVVSEAVPDVEDSYKYAVVTLIGRVKVVDDGSGVVNEYLEIGGAPGIAAYAGLNNKTKIIMLSRIDNTHVNACIIPM